MKIAPEQIARLEAFFDRIQTETYPDNPSALHTEITAAMLTKTLDMVKLPKGAQVLDVSCGQGVAMETFVKMEFSPIGLSINATDIQACRARGFDVREMDQSLLEFEDGEFDLVWCRHCLEHSIFPYYTLSQFARVLKPGGTLYMEVPAPDTACQHQSNPNHYSVLGKSLWMELIRRNGFTLLDVLDINFQVQAGPDVYWAFIAQKPAVG